MINDNIEFYECTEASVEDFCYSLDIIDWEIRRGINDRTLLNEKINRTVINSCRGLFSKIIEQLSSNQKEYIEGFNGVTLRKGKIKYRMEIPEDETVNVKVPRNPIYVNYIVYNFKDKKCKEMFDREHNGHTYNCYCSCNGGSLNMISLSFFMISGYMDIAKWADSLQHELSHEFEQTNIGSNYPISNLYGIVSYYINSEDEGARSASTILYCYNDSERKGYANGLYAYMDKKLMIHPEYYNLRHCDYFKMLKKLNMAVSFVKNNPNDKGILEVLSKIKEIDAGSISYRNLVQKGEIAIKKWNKEASLVLKQYCDDAQKKYKFGVTCCGQKSYEMI